MIPPIQPHSRRQTPLGSLSHQEMDLSPFANKAHQLDSLLHIRSVEVPLSGLGRSVLIFPDTSNRPSVISAPGHKTLCGDLLTTAGCYPHTSGTIGAAIKVL